MFKTDQTALMTGGRTGGIAGGSFGAVVIRGVGDTLDVAVRLHVGHRLGRRSTERSMLMIGDFEFGLGRMGGKVGMSGGAGVMAGDGLVPGEVVCLVLEVTHEGPLQRPSRSPRDRLMSINGF